MQMSWFAYWNTKLKGNTYAFIKYQLSQFMLNICWDMSNLLCVLSKGEITVWSLYAQFSEDQDMIIKPQMPFVKCQRNSWMLYEVSDIKIFKYFLLIG